jgi:hypothetical protein
MGLLILFFVRLAEAGTGAAGGPWVLESLDAGPRNK